MEQVAPYQSPFNVRKRDVVMGLVAIIVLEPFVTWLVSSSVTAYSIVYLALSIAILAGCIMWVHIDAAHKGIIVGHGFRLAMILAMIVALPYYLYSSRGAKYGTIALLKAIGLWFAATIVSAFVGIAVGLDTIQPPVAAPPPPVDGTPAPPPRAAPEKVTQRVKIDDAVIDKNDYFAIIDPVWWSVSIYDGEKVYEENLKKFSREQRYVFAIAWHIAEVNNGGHDQFYYNSTGIVWRDALAGYKAVGLKEAADILQQSANLMGGNPSLDRATREDHLDRIAPNFEELDRRFYALKEASIEKAILKYIRANRRAFYFDGDVEKPK